MAYDFGVGANRDLIALMRAMGCGRGDTVVQALSADPHLAKARLDRGDELFVPECHAQVYAGDTLLHAAAFTYDVETARAFVSAGADVHAKNRRGAEPLHSAVMGSPGSDKWNPDGQVAMIAFLVEAGADPNARASGGVTPLHRAVRNRLSAAVQGLLSAGADPQATNDSGSTALMLAQWTTGRPGSGSPEAKDEQERIIAMLTATSS
ncbi:MAG TPA: ankyrin repeat domain-containing protein [Ilumatobacteraceae bacterium]